MKFSGGGGAPISPWHDIPLYVGDGLLNFIRLRLQASSTSSAKSRTRPAPRWRSPPTSRRAPSKQVLRRARPPAGDAFDRASTDAARRAVVGGGEQRDTKDGALRFYPYNINWNYIYISSVQVRAEGRAIFCGCCGRSRPAGWNDSSEEGRAARNRSSLRGEAGGGDGRIRHAERPPRAPVAPRIHRSTCTRWHAVAVAAPSPVQRWGWWDAEQRASVLGWPEKFHKL